jgi:hypothetical protein
VIEGLLILAFTAVIGFGGWITDRWPDWFDRIAVRWGYNPDNF